MEVSAVPGKGARMKPAASVAIATWLLEHLTFGSDHEALSGDLLEEFQRGRSARWYWRQTLSAIGVGLLRKSRTYTLPLLFSSAWSVLYPAWRTIGRAPLTQALYSRWASLDWPFSTSLTIVNAIVPALTFVWLGFFVYLISRRETAHRVSALPLLGSLSIGLNVLFVSTIALGFSRVDVRDVPQDNLFSNPHLAAISVQLALSVFSAIVCAVPQTRRRHRRADPLAS
jgi:hypothetical protein